jgi:hypothetical protein
MARSRDTKDNRFPITLWHHSQGIETEAWRISVSIEIIPNRRQRLLLTTFFISRECSHFVSSFFLLLCLHSGGSPFGIFSSRDAGSSIGLWSRRGTGSRWLRSSRHYVYVPLVETVLNDIMRWYMRVDARNIALRRGETSVVHHCHALW